MDAFFITSRGILVEAMPDPGNRRRFGKYCISKLHPSEMIGDKYPEGFTIDYCIDILLVTVIISHTREVNFNLENLIWLYGNTSGSMARWSFVHLRLYESAEFIKYFRGSVAELWDSTNIFVIFVEVLITWMAKFLVSYNIISDSPKVYGVDRIILFHKFLKWDHLNPASR